MIWAPNKSFILVSMVFFVIPSYTDPLFSYMITFGKETLVNMNSTLTLEFVLSNNVNLFFTVLKSSVYTHGQLRST